MTKCDTCKKEDPKPLGYRRNFCDDCVKDKEIGVPYSRETVFLRGYGNESAARINELERRVIVPVDRSDGVSDYYVGRRSNSGKIEERTPNIY